MATQTLEDSLAAVEAMRQSDVTLFEAMARDAAKGEVPDPAELNRVMLSTGKDIAAFRNLVATFTKREQLRQSIITAQEAAERTAELKAEVERHNAELEKHVAAHQAATRPIQSEIQNLQQTIHAATTAPQELFNTCPSAELKAKFRAASKRAESLFQAITNENNELERVQADARNHPPGTYDFRLGKIRERIADMQSQLEQAREDSKVLSDAMRDY